MGGIREGEGGGGRRRTGAGGFGGMLQKAECCWGSDELSSAKSDIGVFFLTSPEALHAPLKCPIKGSFPHLLKNSRSLSKGPQILLNSVLQGTGFVGGKLLHLKPCKPVSRYCDAQLDQYQPRRSEYTERGCYTMLEGQQWKLAPLLCEIGAATLVQEANICKRGGPNIWCDAVRWVFRARENWLKKKQ